MNFSYSTSQTHEWERHPEPEPKPLVWQEQPKRLAKQQSTGFTDQEHKRFVALLEEGQNSTADLDDRWQGIASALNKTTDEVKVHTWTYFLSLKSQSGEALASTLSSSWTPQTIALFERLLAETKEGDPKRWDKIASQLGNDLTAVDVRRRFEHLIEEIHSL
jgi:hypothetical protein